MTEQEFDEKMDNFELDDEYTDFIMLHHGADAPHARVICNGDDVIDAIESEYLYDEFKYSMVVE